MCLGVGIWEFRVLVFRCLGRVWGFGFLGLEMRATVKKMVTHRYGGPARRAPPRTACPHPSGTTSHVHSTEPPTIPRRQRHTLSRASASTSDAGTSRALPVCRFVTPAPSRLDGAHESTSPGGPKLGIRGFFVPAGLRQHCAVLFGSSWWGFTGGAESTPQSNVNCQLGARLSSSPRTPKFMSRKKALNFTRAPASRHTRASTRSVGDDLFLIRPERVQAARCLPCGSSGSWHPLPSNRTLNK